MRLLGAVPKKRRAQTRGVRQGTRDTSRHSSSRGLVDGLIYAQGRLPARICIARRYRYQCQPRRGSQNVLPLLLLLSGIYISVPSDVTAMDTTPGASFAAVQGVNASVYVRRTTQAIYFYVTEVQQKKEARAL